MIDWYSIYKLVHVVSSTVLFGSGLGIAFFMWCANRTKDLKIRLFAAKTLVIADLIFTTPAVIVQPISGILLIEKVGYGYFENWLMYSNILFIFICLCWLPVVWIQIQLRDMLAIAVRNNTKLPAKYNLLFNIWFYLGWPAFISVITIFWLMITKL